MRYLVILFSTFIKNTRYKISTSTESKIKVVDATTYIPSFGEKATIIYK